MGIQPIAYIDNMIFEDSSKNPENEVTVFDKNELSNIPIKSNNDYTFIKIPKGDYVLYVDTIGFILIVLPAVMRETPTCKLSGVYSISANHLAGSSKPVTFYGNLNFNMNSVKFEVQGSGFTVNEPIMLQIRASDGYIEFDSEI